MQLDKFCQSCGMPMAMDEKGGGTEANGLKSATYCSMCYVDGKFVDDFTSAKQMQTFVREVLKKDGHGPVKRWFYTMHIPKLSRWQ